MAIKDGHGSSQGQVINQCKDHKVKHIQCLESTAELAMLSENVEKQGRWALPMSAANVGFRALQN